MMLTSQTKRVRTTKERRQQILDAAREVFAKKGLAKTTTAEIAQTAGIAEGTIYNYFQSKRELLISVVSSYILTKPAINLEERASDDFSHTLLVLIDDLLKSLFKDADLQVLLGAEIQQDSDLRERYSRRVLKPGLRMVKEFLETGLNKGALRKLNPAVAARFLVSVMIGLTVLHELEGENGLLRKMPLPDLSSEITALCFAGMASVGE